MHLFMYHVCLLAYDIWFHVSFMFIFIPAMQDLDSFIMFASSIWHLVPCLFHVYFCTCYLLALSILQCFLPHKRCHRESLDHFKSKVSPQNPISDDPLLPTDLNRHADPYLIIGRFVLFHNIGWINLYPVGVDLLASADITALPTWMASP